MTPRETRPGWSLVEVVIVVALLGLIGAAVASVLLHQQRFAGDTADLLDARNGVRDAIEVMSADIRGSSPADTIRLMADSAVEFFASVGTSIVCRASSPTTLVLAGESADGNTLTSLLVQPDTGDLALTYSGNTDSSGRRWRRHRIAAFAPRPAIASCLPGSDSPDEGFAVTLQAPPGPVEQGTPIRFVRRGRYSLYRSSDREWYLGYRRCNALGASVCAAIQPVSGPYRPYSADSGKTGLLFAYFDAGGDRVGSGSALSVVRADITARAPPGKRRLIGHSAVPVPLFARRSVAIRSR